MTDITQIVQNAENAIATAVKDNSVESMINSLKEIKTAYQESGMNSPKNFIEAKALQELSNGNIRHWIYGDNLDSFALRFENQLDRAEIVDIAKKFFKTSTQMEQDQTYYLDSRNYVIGILI